MVQIIIVAVVVVVVNVPFIYDLLNSPSSPIHANFAASIGPVGREYKLIVFFFVCYFINTVK